MNLPVVIRGSVHRLLFVSPAFSCEQGQLRLATKRRPAGYTIHCEHNHPAPQGNYLEPYHTYPAGQDNYDRGPDDYFSEQDDHTARQLNYFAPQDNYFTGQDKYPAA